MIMYILVIGCYRSSYNLVLAMPSALTEGSCPPQGFGSFRSSLLTASRCWWPARTGGWMLEVPTRPTRPGKLTNKW